MPVISLQGKSDGGYFGWCADMHTPVPAGHNGDPERSRRGELLSLCKNTITTVHRMCGCVFRECDRVCFKGLWALSYWHFGISQI